MSGRTKENGKWLRRCEQCRTIKRAQLETVEGRGLGWKCLHCGWWNWLPSAKRGVTGSERQLVQAIYDAAGAHLSAKDYAEAYFTRRKLGDALEALYNSSVAAVAQLPDDELGRP